MSVGTRVVKSNTTAICPPGNAKLVHCWKSHALAETNKVLAARLEDWIIFIIGSIGMACLLDFAERKDRTSL